MQREDLLGMVGDLSADLLAFRSVGFNIILAVFVWIEAGFMTLEIPRDDLISPLRTAIVWRVVGWEESTVDLLDPVVVVTFREVGTVFRQTNLEAWDKIAVVDGFLLHQRQQ